MGGFVKLSRSLTEWEWFSEPSTFAVYIHLHFMAAFRDCRYQGHELKRGQVVTTVAKLSEQSGLSIQQTKTALNRLKSTNKITIKSTTKFSIITLIDYDNELENNKQNNKPITNEQQTNNQPTLLQEEIKNFKNKENARARDDVVSEKSSDIGSVSAFEQSFERFWSSYPKKAAKQNALKAWLKLKPDEQLTEAILSALERFKRSNQWQKDSGQFIPYPATWLNGRRWEDEEPPAPAKIADNTAVSVSKRRSSFDINDIMNKIKSQYADVSTVEESKNPPS